MRPEPPSPVVGRWWSRRSDGRIECGLCPRRCKLREGQRGFCFVRRRDHDQLVLATYGRTSGFCLDPIEKKPLYHFLPGTNALSFGTAGCNLGCRFCQNWDISQAEELDRLTEVASPDRIATAAKRLGCSSVAFTYNDPVIFAEYAIDVAQACRAVGIHSVAVTAGYIDDDARPDFFSAMDAANVDLKAFTERFYRQLCFAELQPVLDTLVYLHRETAVWLEVTTLLIPGENDGEEEIDRMSDWFAAELGPDVPWHFTAYHPDYRLSAPPTPAETVTRARTRARSKGLRYVYTGNVPDPAGSTTWCPDCGQALIRRRGFQIDEYRLAGNRCALCGRPIAGRYDAQCGQADGRRVAVHLA